MVFIAHHMLKRLFTDTPNGVCSYAPLGARPWAWLSLHSPQVKTMNDPEPSLWQSLTFDLDGTTVVSAATAALTRQGLYVVRSFDLRSALAAHTECECPHHGTAQCPCQFTVLLVYGDTPEPVTLTLHCRDRHSGTQAQIVHDPAAPPDPQLRDKITRVLTEITLTLSNAPTQSLGFAASLE